MSEWVGCQVAYHRAGSEGVTYTVKLHHYDNLKDLLDRKETGWIELDSIHGGGKLFLKLEGIVELFYASESWCMERAEQDKKDKQAETLS